MLSGVRVTRTTGQGIEDGHPQRDPDSAGGDLPHSQPVLLLLPATAATGEGTEGSPGSFQGLSFPGRAEVVSGDGRSSRARQGPRGRLL